MSDSKSLPINSTWAASTTGPSAAPQRGWLSRYPLTAFFVLAFLGTWLAIAPLVLGQDGSGLLAYHLPDWLYLLIYVLGAYTGPMLAAYLVLRAEGGKTSVRAWLGRFFQWRVGLHWYIIALFGVYAIWMTAYGLAYRGAPFAALFQPEIWSIYGSALLIGLIVPGYGEEAGWRGFALPRLQARYGPLAGSLVLGGLHGLWHLPVFFTPFLGPFTPLGYTTFILTVLATTIVYTWIINHSRGSILIAVLVHASINASSSALGAAIPADMALTGWLKPFVDNGWLNVTTFAVVAIILLIVTRGRLGYVRKHAAQ